MFDDYKEKVILTYEEKKKANAISFNLIHPAPAKLKEECLRVYEERPLKKDENLFRSFFESKGDAINYSGNIKAIDIDKFRPLINFVKRKTNFTETKNVELLAWLIDFEPRPYKDDFDYINMPVSGGGNSPVPVPTPDPIAVPVPVPVPPKDPESPVPPPIDEPIDPIPPTKKDPPIPPEIKGIKRIKQIIIQKILAFIERYKWLKHAVPKSRNEKAAISLIIIFTIASITYILIRDNKNCMYWTGEHYEAISCEQTVDDVAIIAKDTVKLNHLKKIMHPDTLTLNSLGKVWYVRTYEGLEFYTSDGFHPIYSERRLKPITTHIIDKYILKNKSY